jgi:GT2 family glycosyltransferase
MQRNGAQMQEQNGVGLGLIVSVHIDAFRASPSAYLKAIWWRLRRKRLRSRGQLAPLLAASSRAYELWIAQGSQSAAPKATDEDPPIIALVESSAYPGEIQETIDSLSPAGISALVIGSSATRTLAEAASQIDWSLDPWLMPMKAGDRIAIGAAKAYRDAIPAAQGGLVYADDDLLSKSGRRTKPHLKPDWNSELFSHFDYLSGSCILRSSCADLQDITGNGDWMRQLVARAVERANPLHLRKILHHRRERPRPCVPQVPVMRDRELPPVTIIVPTRNQVRLLKICLEGVAATDYPQKEVIVVDNDSDDPETLTYICELEASGFRILRHSGKFNYSAINNRAVAQASGQFVCLLNNDVEVIEPNWLTAMALQALRDDVGAVGARLLYPDRRIQHAGVVLGVGNAAGHAHRLLRPDEEGYFQRHSLPQFTSAVTAACLVVSRDRFLAVGGLDERNFPVAFNDVDLCMRLNKRGWQSLYEPRATLIHHESVSRGFDKDPLGAARFAGELAALKRLWGTEKLIDPYHHPELSRASERFVLRLWGV